MFSMALAHASSTRYGSTPWQTTRSKESFARHQETQHYLEWREAVKDWMAEPRLGLRYLPLFYGDAEVS